MFGWFKRHKDPELEIEQEPELIEKRASERRNIFADGSVTSESGMMLKKGIALDLSSDGVMFRFDNIDGLYDGMIVHIPRHGIKRAATVRWCSRTDVGMQFLAKT